MLKLKVTNKDSGRYIFLKFSSNFYPNISKMDSLMSDSNFLGLKISQNNIDTKVMQAENDFDKFISTHLDSSVYFRNIIDAYGNYYRSSEEMRKLVLDRFKENPNFPISDIAIFIQVREFDLLKQKNPELYPEVDYDAKNIVYRKISLFNKLVLYTDRRIDRESVPKGLYVYEVGSDDKQEGIICRIAERIYVNHWGTILSLEKIKLGEQRVREIDEDKDIKFGVKNIHTIDDYVKKKRKEQVR